MSFKLNAKTFLFQVLDKLPNKMGDSLYHKIQEILNGNDINFKIESSKNTYFAFQHIARSLKIPVSSRTLIEIGSGWMPIMPYFLLYLGKMERVVTYDLNEHYNKNSITKLNGLFSQKFEVKIDTADGEFPLPKNLGYYPNTNIIDAKLPVAEIVFSRFVLEHIAPQDIVDIHRKLKNELQPGSHIFHFISPGDHRAYVDKSLSLQDFLKYSKSEWKKKHTRFDYHNRLRLPEYIKIFESVGLEIIHLEYSNPPLDSEQYKQFKTLKLHPDYKNFSEEELTAGAINIVLKV